MSNHAMAMNKVLQDNVNYQHHDRTVGKSKKKWGHVVDEFRYWNFMIQHSS